MVGLLDLGFIFWNIVVECDFKNVLDMSQSVLKVNDLPAEYSGPCLFLLKTCIIF